MSDLQIPSGHQRLMPYFLVPDAEAFIAFLKETFGASDREMHRDADGRVMHAELNIGTSVLMLGQSSEQWKDGTSMNYVYVADTDNTHARCLAKGCTELYAPRNEDYGMRSSGVKDAWGNTWWLAQPIAE